jgi:hypothetical protein
MTGLTEVAATGSRLEVLRAVRDMLAERIDKGVGARELSPLSRLLMRVVAEIADLEAVEGVGTGGAPGTPPAPMPLDPPASVIPLDRAREGR